MSGLMFIQSCFIPFSINYTTMIRSWVEFGVYLRQGSQNRDGPYLKSDVIIKHSQTRSLPNLNQFLVYFMCSIVRNKEPIPKRKRYIDYNTSHINMWVCNDFSFTSLNSSLFWHISFIFGFICGCKVTVLNFTYIFLHNATLGNT